MTIFNLEQKEQLAKAKIAFERPHPEAFSNEKFFSNFSPKEFSNFNPIKYGYQPSQLRKGVIAYDVNGIPIPGDFPVFLKIK